jgi:Adenylyl/Guanylyl and SMODS C-terminal sensor domain
LACEELWSSGWGRGVAAKRRVLCGKVRNFGSEARRRQMERGEIAVHGSQITETAHFEGPHWVQVWAVRDGVAVATSRQEVTIVPKG